MTARKWDDSERQAGTGGGKTLVYVGATLIVLGVGMQLVFALSVAGDGAPAQAAEGVTDSIVQSSRPTAAGPDDGASMGGNDAAPEPLTFGACARAHLSAMAVTDVDQYLGNCATGARAAAESRYPIDSKMKRPEELKAAFEYVRQVSAVCNQIAKACGGSPDAPDWGRGQDDWLTLRSPLDLPLGSWHTALTACAPLAEDPELQGCAEDMGEMPLGDCQAQSLCRFAHAVGLASDDQTLAAYSTQVNCRVGWCRAVRDRCSDVIDPPNWFKQEWLADAKPGPELDPDLLKVHTALGKHHSADKACPRIQHK